MKKRKLKYKNLALATTFSILVLLLAFSFAFIIGGEKSSEFVINDEYMQRTNPITGNSIFSDAINGIKGFFSADTQSSTFGEWDPPIEHLLAINVMGTGSGYVFSDDFIISCPDVCNFSYEEGKNVTLNAVTDPSYNLFSEWQGCNLVYGSENTFCNVTMTGNKTINATFTLRTSFNLSLLKVGGGFGLIASVSTPSQADQLNCGSSCLNQNVSYNMSTIVTLTPSPMGGSTFIGWGGYCSGTGVCNLNMAHDTSVTANFSLIVPSQLQLKLWQEGDINGTVISTSVPDNGDQFNCGSNCDYQTKLFINGTNVSLSFTSPLNYYVAYHLGCDNPYNENLPSTWNRCNVSLRANRTVRVAFEKPTLELLKNSATSSGTVTSNPAGINCGLTCTQDYFDFDFNSIVTLIAVPSSGYNTNWVNCDVVYGFANNFCNMSMNNWRSVNVTFNSVVCNTGADTAPYGNCDQTIQQDEINNYIDGYYLGNVNIVDVSISLDAFL
mgnify:CR=1 FL=1